MKYMKPITTVFTGFLAVAASFGPSDSRAAEYDVLDIPLIVSIESIPNVFLEMDDSGSMNWEIMAGPHWTMCAYDGFVHSSISFPGSDTSGGLKTRCASNNSDDRPAGDVLHQLAVKRPLTVNLVKPLRPFSRKLLNR
jgi:hypothetical protein